MAQQQPSVEQIIDHHLTQNLGQKLTPHLLTGLVMLISQNLRTAGHIVVAEQDQITGTDK